MCCYREPPIRRAGGKTTNNIFTKCVRRQLGLINKTSKKIKQFQNQVFDLYSQQLINKKESQSYKLISYTERKWLSIQKNVNNFISPGYPLVSV